MKKFTSILILSILLLSCTTEEEQLDIFAGEVTASDVDGTWNVTEFYTNNGKIATKIEGINVTADFDSEGKDFQSQVTFSQSPNIVTSEGDFTNTTTVSYLTFSQTEESTQSLDFAGTWTINNNIISITNVTTTNYTIVDYTGNLLKLRYDVSENVDLMDGITGDATATFYITLTK